MKQNTNKAKLITRKMSTLLVQLTLPMMWGVLAFISFNVADTYFIGQLGTTELAAVSFTFPVIMVLFNLTIGLGIGLSSTVARAIGEGDEHTVRHLVSSGILLTVFIGMALAGIGLMLIEPIFQMLGASEDLIVIIKPYMQIMLYGIAFLMIPIVGNAAIRATGDSKSPGLMMVGAAILNVILDPILIFGWLFVPGMGVTGAAIASLIGRFMTLLVSLSILIFRERLITLRLDGIGAIFKSWSKILHVAAPAAATNMIIPIGMGVIMSLLAQHGKEVVAGFGVAMRIEAFAFVFMYALSSVVGPVVGQNWGAGLIKRVKKAVNLSALFCIGWGTTAAIILAISGRFLAQLFNEDLLVIRTVQQYFWIVSIGYGAHGVIMLMTAVLNGLGKAFFSAGISFTRFFILYVPMAYLGDYFFGVKGIFAAFPIASIVMAIIAYIIVLKRCRYVTMPKTNQERKDL